MNQIINKVSVQPQVEGSYHRVMLRYQDYVEIVKCAQWSFYGIVNNGRR